jgi:hypothetical protein
MKVYHQAARNKGVPAYWSFAVFIGLINVAGCFRFEVNNLEPVCIVEHLPRNEVSAK